MPISLLNPRPLTTSLYICYVFAIAYLSVSVSLPLYFYLLISFNFRTLTNTLTHQTHAFTNQILALHTHSRRRIHSHSHSIQLQTFRRFTSSLLILLPCLHIKLRIKKSIKWVGTDFKNMPRLQHLINLLFIPKNYVVSFTK